MNSLLIVLIGFALLLLLMILWAVQSYVRVPANKLLVIYGKVLHPNEHGVQILSEGGVFVWPVIQDHAFLDLQEIMVDIQSNVQTKDGESFDVKTDLSCAIGKYEPLASTAAVRLLGKSRSQIKQIVEAIISNKIIGFFHEYDTVDVAIHPNVLIARLVESIQEESKKIGIALRQITITPNKSSNQLLADIESRFKENLATSFPTESVEDVQQKLAAINQAIQSNLAEKQRLMEQKIKLLTSTKIN